MNNKNEPIHLTEDVRTGGHFLIYATEKGLRLEIRFQEESLWMTQAQIADLFGRDVGTISRHIKKILEDGELSEETSLQKMQTTHGRPSTIYSLDMVLSVGYRVSSAQATLFRKWATGILVQYARKGFVVDAARLKESDNADRIAELREIIRDIRSDEANLYAELKRICSLCQDYDGNTQTARKFFQTIQAKIVHAVASCTPSEIIHARADHARLNMGLTSWKGDRIAKKDVTVSKNYFSESEIKELNRLTGILLDIFEDQMDIGRLVVMSDALNLLDKQLKSLGRSVLESGGQISRKVADMKAEKEYALFDQQRRLERKKEADRQVAALLAEAKKLPGRPAR